MVIWMVISAPLYLSILLRCREMVFAETPKAVLISRVDFPAFSIRANSPDCLAPFGLGKVLQVAELPPLCQVRASPQKERWSVAVGPVAVLGLRSPG